jgi:hypothetical protein
MGIAQSDGALFLVTHDGLVCRFTSQGFERVSNHSIERLIQEDASQQSISAMAWTREGHSFVNFTGASWSRCYDAATGVWHTRKSYGRDNWRARNPIRAWGKTIIQDALTGKLGAFDSETFTEYGNPLVWSVTSPTLHAAPDGLIIDAFHMDVAVGYGALSGQGSNPKLMLEVSKDGGNTFAQYRELELGARGAYATRLTARRLGRTSDKGVVFRITISDPVVRALVGTSIDVRPLKRSFGS